MTGGRVTTMAINHLNAPTGNIADNVVGFARALRAAGIPVGPGAIIDAMNALQLVEIGNRADVYAALESIFVTRHEHALIFAQAFDLFFRATEEWKHMLDSVPLPEHARKKPPPASRRVQEALAQPVSAGGAAGPGAGTAAFGVRQGNAAEEGFCADDRGRDRRGHPRDREDEAAAGGAAYPPLPAGCARLAARHAPHPARILRTGGEIIDIHKLGRIDKPAPIVALLDISGSMSEYTRLFLHFLHAITDARKRVSVFLFGTRLTNVTRSLRARDPDEALASCSSSVEDWAGGTRIATSLHTFNKMWARRVLGQGAIVLLISDGLEREGDDKLAFEMDRLHRSCRRLIWLNPLLRFGGFEAKAQGIKMMLPHVDEFRPVHNLSSIEGLIEALSAPPTHQRSLIRPAA